MNFFLWSGRLVICISGYFHSSIVGKSPFHLVTLNEKKKYDNMHEIRFLLCFYALKLFPIIESRKAY